jgi:outer membrane protein insertion porin family
MIKFLTILTLVIFTFFKNSSAEIIEKIILENNNRITVETIKTYGDIEIGKNYSNDDLNKILKNLYETNFFEDVKLSIKDKTLKISVIENKIIQSVSIVGIKSQTTQKAILDSLILKDKSSFIESVVEGDILKIRSSLNFQGYYFAEVKSYIKDNINNTVDLVYDIDLGEKAKISRIEFSGNKVVKDRTLRNLITTEESKFWKFLSKKKFLNKDNLLRDERLLRQFYLNEGYYDVVINTSTANLLDNKSFNVTYNINAGNLYKINNTKLILPIDYDPENFKNITELLENLKDKRYSFSKITKVVNSIDKISLSREYDFISAELIENKVGENKIDVAFKVYETPKLYIEKINIFGNVITQDNVIRNSLEIDEGDPFNELLNAKSTNKIRSLNIFKTVKSEVIEGTNPNTKIININVTEKPTGEISLGAGVSSDGGTIGFAVSENNFMGKGVKLSSSLRLSNETLRGNFTVQNPNFNYTGRSLITNIESTKIDKLDSSGFETSKNGFSVGTRFEQYENIYLSPSISTYWEDLETNSTASASLRKQQGQYFENRLTYALDYDARNRKYKPTEGIRSRFVQGVPLYSDEYSLLNGYELTKWYEFENSMVASLGLYTKMINALADDEDVRISDRLNLPNKKLKGFESGKVGPKDGSDFIGGNYAASLNFKTSLPMLLPSLETTDFTFFLDAGNVWGVDYSNSINDSNKLRSSTGLALDWYTPIGPLNFSLAQSITKAESDKTQFFQFNLGTTF